MHAHPLVIHRVVAWIMRSHTSTIHHLETRKLHLSSRAIHSMQCWRLLIANEAICSFYPQGVGFLWPRFKANIIQIRGFSESTEVSLRCVVSSSEDLFICVNCDRTKYASPRRSPSFILFIPLPLVCTRCDLHYGGIEAKFTYNFVLIFHTLCA